MTTKIVLIPKLLKDERITALGENEFLTSFDLVVDDAELDANGMKYLKYAVTGDQLSIDLDEKKQPVNLKWRKLKKFFIPFPLHDFICLKGRILICTITT